MIKIFNFEAMYGYYNHNHNKKTKIEVEDTPELFYLSFYYQEEPYMKSVAKKNTVVSILAIIIIVLSLFFSFYRINPSIQRHVFYRLDTVFEVSVVSKSTSVRRYLSDLLEKKEKIQNTWDVIDSFLKDYERRFSQSDKNSELLKLNETKGKIKHISPELCEILKIALHYGGDSLGGMFDVTINPVKNLWGLCEECTLHVVPSPAAVQAVMQHVNYKTLYLDTENNTILYNDTNVTIDVGGIAKKHSLRKVAGLLDGMGYDGYLINAGGDLTSRGRKPDGKKWRIGIEHPRNAGKMLAIFDLDSGSVVTSGDYERYWITVDGKRIHHIFNSKTGYSCTNNQSVTIWTADPEMADVLSTGLFCLSTGSIMSFVEKRPYIQCVVVDSVGNVFVSSGWKEKIHIRNN